MTFVAQPFEQFVDEILTALTGGFVREEHRFEGAGEPYPLGTASAVPASVRIVGQGARAFRAFERGIDFEYLPAAGAIRWIDGGATPDDRSFFYLSYQPTEGVRRLTDRNTGSVSRTLAEAFARQFAVLHQQMDVIYRSAFVDLSSDVSLDHVAALLDLTRRDARYAIGEVLFKRSTPAPAAIAIPSGTLVSTLDGITFATTEERRLRRSQLSVSIPIRAREPGAIGAVPAGAITVLNEPLLGVEAVVNTEATHFDRARETDDELRRRIKGAIERAGRASPNAILRTLMEEVPQINETNARLVERIGEPGLVELQFGLAGVDEGTVRRIDDAIFRSRPAGVRVVHNLGALGKRPANGAGASNGGALPAQPAMGSAPPRATLSPEELRGLPEGVLPLRVEVLYRLTQADVSPAARDDIEAGVRDRLSAHIEALPMDADLVHSKLLGRVVEAEVIADATVRIGLATGTALYERNLATAGRKVTIGDPQADVFVGPMLERVLLEVTAAVQLVPGADGAATPARWELTVKDALSQALAEPRGALATADVERLVRAALEGGPFRLAARGGVALGATFEDSGRFLAAPETIELAPHQQIAVGPVALDVGGPLDG
jgi:uncharacterized phage protein gp47/JayE